MWKFLEKLGVKAGKAARKPLGAFVAGDMLGKYYQVGFRKTEYPAQNKPVKHVSHNSQQGGFTSFVGAIPKMAWLLIGGFVLIMAVKN